MLLSLDADELEAPSRDELTYISQSLCTSGNPVQTKLTLRLEAALIRRAKARARARGTSLSVMVSDWFAALDEVPDGRPAALPPRTRSLRGILAGKRLHPADWHDHLERKHLR